MKAIPLLSLLVTASTLLLSSCDSIEENDHDNDHDHRDHRQHYGGSTTTTTTEETTLRNPYTNSVETQTTRRY